MSPRLEEHHQTKTFSHLVKDSPWEKVERALEKIPSRFEQANHSEDFQQIGLLCREILISLGQAVFDPQLHLSTDEVDISRNDVKGMLGAYLKHELAGKRMEAVRKHARAALDLTNSLQHQREASYKTAALCTEATISVVNIVSIISGRIHSGFAGSLLDRGESVSMHRVIQHINSLNDMQRSVLKSSFDSAETGSGSGIFGWTITGGGLCLVESQLYFFLDHEAITLYRKDEPTNRDIIRWYRFKSWLFEYLSLHPEVLSTSR